MVNSVDGGWAWVVVAAGTVLFMISGAGLNTLGIIVVELKLVLDIPVEHYLWVVNIIFILHMAVGPLVSYFIHNFGHRHVASFGVILLTLSMVGLSYSKSLAALILTFSIPAGVGYGCIILTSLLLPSSGYFDKKKGLAIGVISSGSGIGGVVITQILRASFDSLPFSFATLLYGGVILQGVIAAALLRPFKTERMNKANSEPTQKIQVDRQKVEHTSQDAADCTYDQIEPNLPQDISSQFNWKLITNPRLMMICVSMFLYCMGLDMVMSCIPLLGESKGLHKKIIAAVITASGVCEIVFRILSGLFADKKIIPVMYQYTVCLIMAGGGTLLCGVVSGLPGIVIAVTGLVMGTGVFGLVPLVLEELLGKQHVTTGMGYQAFFQGIAMIPSTPVAGYLHHTTASWDIVFIYLGSCMLLSGLMLVPYCIYSKCSTQQNNITIERDHEHRT